ncbi:hypothetical protein D3C80_1933760 [compost metagenome]
MIGRHDHPDRLVDQQFVAQLRIVVTDPEHTGIDAFFLQRLDLRRRGHFMQTPVDLRITLAKQVQGLGQHADHH